MRKDIHPEYREVLFHDTNADVYFLTRSTVSTKTTREYEGQEYPYFPLELFLKSLLLSDFFSSKLRWCCRLGWYVI